MSFEPPLVTTPVIGPVKNVFAPYWQRWLGQLQKFIQTATGFSVNGVPVANPNLSNTIPVAAPAPCEDLNISWQVSGSNVSGYIPILSPLTNGDPDSPELIFFNGDVIMIFPIC